MRSIQQRPCCRSSSSPKHRRPAGFISIRYRQSDGLTHSGSVLTIGATFFAGLQLFASGGSSAFRRSSCRVARLANHASYVKVIAVQLKIALLERTPPSATRLRSRCRITMRSPRGISPRPPRQAAPRPALRVAEESRKSQQRQAAITPVTCRRPRHGAPARMRVSRFDGVDPIASRTPIRACARHREREHAATPTTAMVTRQRSRRQRWCSCDSAPHFAPRLRVSRRASTVARPRCRE